MTLNPKIRQFIDEMRELEALGCVLVTHSSLPRLKELLDAEKIPYEEKKTGASLEKTLGLWIVTEEDYQENPAWAAQVREVVDYFFNVA